MMGYVWVAVWCSGSAFFGWVGGYCFGWLVGTEDTERRWSDAVKRRDERLISEEHDE